MMKNVLIAIALIAFLALTYFVGFQQEAFLQTGFGAFLVDSRINILQIMPEIILTLCILFLVLYVAFANNDEERQLTWLGSFFGVLLTLVGLGAHLYFVATNNVWFFSQPVFYNMFQADAFSLIARTLMAFGTLMLLLFSQTYINQPGSKKVTGEFYIVLLTALLGGMLLVGAQDIIMLFVALETLGIASYILVGYLRDDAISAEAALKYLLFGGVASASLLFGLSLLYGFSGATNYHEIALNLTYGNAALQTATPFMAVMSVLIFGGFCFKLSAAPFHMWTPDVYEGAPLPVTAFLSVVSKIAGFVAVMRFLTVVMPGLDAWVYLIAGVSILSMVIGNVAALVQNNIKRLLAYSTIAHAGYMLLGLTVIHQSTALQTLGLSSVMYYLITYLFMNIGAFAIITHFHDMTGSDEIVSYSGLAQKKPWMTFSFSIMLLSLAGIPITAGFFGKFFLFQAVAQAGTQYLWLVIVALLTSTISLYYYLKVIRLMVIEEPSAEVLALKSNVDEYKFFGYEYSTVVMTVCLIFTLALGFLADPVLNTTKEAVKGLRHGQEYSNMMMQAPTKFPMVAVKRQ